VVAGLCWPAIRLCSPVAKHQLSGRISARLSVEVTNTNDFLVKYRVTVKCEVNGTQSDTATFEGFVPAHQNRFLIASEIPNVASAAQNQPFVSGWLDYDVTYFAAPAGRATRRTSRHVEFHTDQGRQDNPPGTQIRAPIITRFSFPSGLAGPAAHETLPFCGRAVGIEVGIPLVRLSPRFSWTRGSWSTSDCRHGPSSAPEHAS